MGRITMSVRSQAGSMPKTYAATSKHGAKADGKIKLREQLEAAGGTVTRTIREGFVVQMSRVQRSVFMRDHPDTHLADLAVEGA